MLKRTKAEGRSLEGDSHWIRSAAIAASEAPS
jgi:hypothetical protein